MKLRHNCDILLAPLWGRPLDLTGKNGLGLLLVSVKLTSTRPVNGKWEELSS